MSYSNDAWLAKRMIMNLNYETGLYANLMYCDCDF